MKKIAKIITLVLCISLCFSACKGKENSEESTTSSPEQTTSADDSFAITDGKVVLPYNKTDGINPFFAESYENIYLSMLIYEPLFSVDSNYDTTGIVADHILYMVNVAGIESVGLGSDFDGIGCGKNKWLL